MSTHWPARTRFLLIAAAVLVVFNLSREAYRWVAFADERVVLRRMMAQVDTAALNVMRTQMEADSLIGAIEVADGGLLRDRDALLSLERRAENNRLPPMLYDEYQGVLARYNVSVEARNEMYESWRTVVDRNHAAVGRYNALADSIRGLGARMGEPYISVPSPAEVAVQHGLEPRLRR